MRPSKRALRQERLKTALEELETLRTELAFDEITVTLSDFQRHWQFKYGDKHLADWWPASAKGQLTGSQDSVDCVSTSQAQKLAIAAKKKLFTEIRQALQQR